MEFVCHCSCSHDRHSSSVPADSNREPLVIWSQQIWILRAFYGVVRLIAGAISKVLTVCFAIGGAFSGAIAGALAGWASNRGIIRGAALVAIAGASISLEFLDAVRTNWCSNCSSSCSLSSMTKLLQRLLHQRFADEQLEQFLPVTSSTHLWSIVCTHTMARGMVVIVKTRQQACLQIHLKSCHVMYYQIKSGNHKRHAA